MSHRTRTRRGLGNGAVKVNMVGSNGDRLLNKVDMVVLSIRQILGPQCKGDLGNIINTRKFVAVIRYDLGMPAVWWTISLYR